MLNIVCGYFLLNSLMKMSKITLSILCLLAINGSLSYAQQDGRYRPFTTAPTRKPLYPAFGRYNPNKNDGRYYPSEEGKYRGSDDGKYRPNADDNGSYNPKTTIKTADVGREKVIGRGKNTGSQFNPRTDFGRTKPAPAPEAISVPALPAGSGTSIGRNDFKIVYLYNQAEKDGYHYIYETENGILAEEEGHIVELPTGEGLRAQGFFEYTGDDGSLYRVDYVADDAGFVPRGAHIPQTPPHVVKLLEYLALNAKQ